VSAFFSGNLIDLIKKNNPGLFNFFNGLFLLFCLHRQGSVPPLVPGLPSPQGL